MQSTVPSLRFFSLNLGFFALVGLIVRRAGHPWLGVLRHRWLTYLGQISYGLYLYHHIIFMLWDDAAIRWGFRDHLGCDLAKAAVSFAVAAPWPGGSWSGPFYRSRTDSGINRAAGQGHRSHLPRPVVVKDAKLITEPRHPRDRILSSLQQVLSRNGGWGKSRRALRSEFRRSLLSGRAISGFRDRWRHTRAYG